MILGPVTNLAHTMNSIQDRPLLGQTVLVTRPAEQAEALAAPLRELGAQVLLQPAIEIGPPESWSEVDRSIATLSEFDLVVFCSHNGVRFFMDRLLQTDSDGATLDRPKLRSWGAERRNHCSDTD